MESIANYVASAEACASNGSSVEAGDELSAYWQREAQIQATLALVAALVEIRDEITRAIESRPA